MRLALRLSVRNFAYTSPQKSGPQPQPSTPGMTMQVVKTRKPLFGLLVQSGLGRFADRMAAIVYGWAILQQTGSGLWAGVVIAAHVGVLVIGTLFAGRLIARFGARRVAL